MDWLIFIVDYGIIGFLILLSVIAVGIGIERFFFFRSIRLDAFTDYKSLELELTRKIHLIATIGSNAPYIGLLVAIPSVSLYNFVLRRVKVLLMTWEIKHGRKDI